MRDFIWALVGLVALCLVLAPLPLPWWVGMIAGGLYGYFVLGRALNNWIPRKRYYR